MQKEKRSVLFLVENFQIKKVDSLISSSLFYLTGKMLVCFTSSFVLCDCETSLDAENLKQLFALRYLLEIKVILLVS